MAPTPDQHHDLRSTMEQQGRDISEIKDKIKDLPDIKSMVSHIANTLDRVLNWKDGDGDKPSIEVRLDRIEQFILASKWVIAVCLTVLLSTGTLAVIYLIAQQLHTRPQ